MTDWPSLRSEPASLQRHSPRAAARAAVLRLARGDEPIWLAGAAPAGATRPEGLARPPARLLVIRPDHLGDIVFAGPALRRLATGLPDARLTFLVGPWSAEIARLAAPTAQVRTLHFPWYDRAPKPAPWEPYRRLSRAAQTLTGQYDAALILRDDDWWGAWLSRLAGIPLRVGHAPVARFLTHALPAGSVSGPPGPPRHAAAQNLELVEALLSLTGVVPAAGPAPALELTLPESAALEADAMLRPLTSGGGTPRILAIHPGSGSAIKRWPADRWAELVGHIAHPADALVVTGGPDEIELAGAIADAVERPCLNLAGRTSVATLAAVFRRCSLVVGPDSGPLHIAVAVGTPSVHLYGPADPRRFGPWGPAAKHRVVSLALPCEPCGRLDWPEPLDHPCVAAIPVAAVAAAARGLFGPPPGQPIIP